MDALLWVLLIVVVVGAVWWFRSRAPLDSRSQVADDAGPRSTPALGEGPDPRGRQIKE
ncbi:hypothetical protein [Arthrobacter sp. HLT1-21]